MSVRNRTLGVVVQKTEEGTEAFCAGVVWGALPWLAGAGEGATPGEALSKLKARLRRHLGDDPEVVVFDTLEAAQTEGRRRLAAEDLLRTLEHACVRLPEVLAGEQTEPDGRDREAIGSLEEAVLAVRAVAVGLYDAEKRREQALIQDGKLVCPRCGPDYPEAYFTATADALVTAYLSPDGRLTGWKDPYVFGEEFRELRCGSCGRSFGDLTFDQLPGFETEEEKA